jgi:hypothetical protein
MIQLGGKYCTTSETCQKIPQTERMKPSTSFNSSETKKVLNSEMKFQNYRNFLNFQKVQNAFTYSDGYEAGGGGDALR